MRLLLSLIFAFAASAAAAQAPKSVSLPYEATYFPPDNVRGEAVATYASATGMQFEGKFGVWYLLGEPIINCTARWSNSAGTNMSLDADGDGSNTIEAAREGEIEVYNLMLAASGPDPRDKKYGYGSAKTIVALCDAGMVAQNGRDGFNVAGSPSWDKFLCALPDAHVRLRRPDADSEDYCAAISGKWLDADAAKAVARQGVNFDDVTALKAEINSSAVIKRVEKRTWREKSAAFKHERTAAMLAYKSKEGDETAWDAHYRRMDALNALPDLPLEDPSTEQLAAYETAYQALIAEQAPGDAFVKEWRAKEKALVGEQLARVRKLDRAAAKEEERFFNYLHALNALKKNEPVQPDPMAAYRTATLIPFSKGTGLDLVCGLKSTDGSVAVSGDYYRYLDGGCPEQFVKGFGIYIVSLEEGHGATVRGGPFENDAICTYKTGCALYYDNDGRLLYKGAYNFARRTGSAALHLKYGLIAGLRYDRPEVYSLLKQKILIDDATTFFPKTPGSRTSVSVSRMLFRNGELALLLRARNETSNLGCGYQETIYSYFYLDRETFENPGVCTSPDDDPLNENHP